jgi:integrase
MKEIQITLGMIDDFLSALASKGKNQETLRVYRGILERWYASLPEDKFISEDVQDSWAADLREKGVTERTLNNYASTLKLFLKYLEDPTAIREMVPYEQTKKAALEHATTREEYRLMLHVAKELGYRRTYLLIKTIGGLGIRSTEIQNLTVGCLKQGELSITSRGITHTVKIHEPIRAELLRYATERGIEEGPIFITKDGQSLQYFMVWKEIKKLCRQMGIPEDKGSPSSLYNMHLETKRNLSVTSIDDVGLKYQELLQEDEAIIGENASGVLEKSQIDERESLPPINVVIKSKGAELRKEEKEYLTHKMREALPKGLMEKYDCEVKVKILFTPKQDK